MPKQQATADLAKANTPEPRYSERARTPTQRFVEGWFGTYLPRLSQALGLSVAPGKDADDAGAAKSSSDDGKRLSACSRVDEEARNSHTICEVEGSIVVGGCDLRRSERERTPTKRFMEGWFGVHLPRLSSALGSAVADGQDD